MINKQHIIDKVTKNSIAEEVGIEPGDILININGEKIKDALDFYYFTTEHYLELEVKKKNGEDWIIEIEKEEDEPLGIEFSSTLMDEYKSCTNKCIFCFVDQLPKGMRETLYFKDDDSRLSFLQGNYITLTNMKEEDIKRIIKYRLSPINISVHTTNPDLRIKMLNNRFAGNIINYIKMFYKAGIIMNGQIVLCKGINDGKELFDSIKKLSEFIPYMQSVSVVPVGLSRHREGLHPLEPFTKEDAKDVLEIIHYWQDKLYKEDRTHFIHAGDEFYLLAESKIPNEDKYDEYLQLENGVGMLRVFTNDFEEEYERLKIDYTIDKECAIVTGFLAYHIINSFVKRLKSKYPNLKVHIYPIKNKFFGERITVSGLLTGKDIINQLKNQRLGQELLLPSNLLKNDEQILLDDVTVTDIEKALQVKVTIVQSIGKDFIQSIIK
ncbi:MAG: DUF512 domain-containing protein [Eubacteriales bacterium]